MNAKIIAGIIIAIILGIGIYFATKPISKASNSKEHTESITTTDHSEEETTEKETSDTAYADFLNWQKNESPSPQETEDYLVKLEEKHPNDYRFTLERIRGAAKVKGVHSHKEEFEILEEAVHKTAACECGDAQKMLEDLHENKSNKERGFWKLSTHPREWSAVIKALTTEDLKTIKESGGHRH